MLTIGTLPLAGYIKCTVHGDLSVLGEPVSLEDFRIQVSEIVAANGNESEETDAVKQLYDDFVADARKDAWLNINSDYCLIVDDADQKSQTEQDIRIYELTAIILRVTLLVEAMRDCYSPAIKEALQEAGIDLDFNPDEPEQYESDLERALVELVQHKIEIANIVARQAAMSEGEKKASVTEEYFDEILMEIYTNIVHSVVTDLDRIKEEMMTRTYALYLKRLRKFYANPQI